MSMSRRSGRLRWLLLAALCTALSSAASASAATTERFAFAVGLDVQNDGDVCTVVCQSGRAGSGAGELNQPTGVAAIGNEFFVTEGFNFRVSVFNATTGQFERAFGLNVGGQDINTCTTTCQAGNSFECGGTPPTCTPVFGIGGPAGITAVGSELYIGEASAHRVGVYNAATGAFVRAYGKAIGGPGNDICGTSFSPCVSPSFGAAAGQLVTPFGVAVSNGELFVSDETNNRVNVFDVATGAFKRAFGKGVDPAGGDICTTATTCKAGSAGAGTPGQIGFTRDIAISNGKVFVDDYLHNRVSIFNTAGTFQAAIGTNVDTAGGHICITTCQSGEAGSGPGDIYGANDVSASGGELFVSDRINHRIDVFDTTTFAFKRALGTEVAGPGTRMCTDASCQSGIYNGFAGDFASAAGTVVADGRLAVVDAQLPFQGEESRLMVVDPTTGAFLHASGRSVQPGGGTESDICRFVCQAGKQSFDAASVNGFSEAVAGNELFVADLNSHRVAVYDTRSGELLRLFGKDVGGPGHDTCTDLCTVTTPGDGPGNLNQPAGIAVDNGLVYVADPDNGRISVFTTAGTFEFAIGKGVGGAGHDTCSATCNAGSKGSGAGELSNPANMTVANSELFVADELNNRVSVFKAADGTFVRTIGKNVDGQGGSVCMSSCQGGVRDHGAGELAEPVGVAVSGDELFVSELGNARVSVFNRSTGAFIHAFGKDVNQHDADGLGRDVCVTTCNEGSLLVGGVTAAGAIPDPRQITLAGTELFVGDSENGRVSVFDAASGTFLRAFGKDVGGPGIDNCTSTCFGGNVGFGAGEIRTSVSVAVAGTSVFVGEGGDPRISVFSNSPDKTAPETTVTGISGLTKNNTQTFGFTSSEPGSSFECSLDSLPFRFCTSSVTTPALADGPHTFEVRAIDAVFNTDPTPALRSFTVDTTPPQTTITNVSGPTSGRFTLTFTSSETNSTFECRVDSGSFAACFSPFTSASLSTGSHTFQVRATDAAGNTDPTPDTRTVGPVLVAANTSSPNYVLQATLTPGGAPLAGQTITFTAGSTALCSAVTGSTGVATCSVSTKPKIAAIANARGYTASWAGNGTYPGASATGALGSKKG